MEIDPTLADATRLAIYRHFADTGQAPAATDIAQALRRDVSEIEEALDALAAERVIVLSPPTRSIWMAHPFSAVPTSYRVESDGTSYWANCAWDALGIGAMLAQDTQCECQCAGCGQRMDLSVKRGTVNSTGVVHFLVPPRQFWENIGYT